MLLGSSFQTLGNSTSHWKQGLFACYDVRMEDPIANWIASAEYDPLSLELYRFMWVIRGLWEVDKREICYWFGHESAAVSSVDSTCS